MITRQEFPYLQELIINDAYAVKNLRVPVFQPGQEFKHLVLTGRNGSGKTTVLRGLHNELTGNPKPAKMRETIHSVSSHPLLSEKASINLADSLKELSNIIPYFSNNNAQVVSETLGRHDAIIPFFEAFRQTKVKDTKSVLSEQKLDEQIFEVNNKNQVSDLFKQYLVNKKVFQVFDILEGNTRMAEIQNNFFITLEYILSEIFHDKGLKLDFVRDIFEFYINFSNGKRLTFNQLSAGYSAFLSILMDLLMRTDLVRRKEVDYTYDPCGFVLIDEPETHLHLEMQYQILPLLTSLFPNLQFIVATHSPAVASSIKNATVFDLSTGQALGDSAAGSSFSELMQTHFGLKNEYSNVADDILKTVSEISEMPDRAAARASLQKLLDEQGRYMSPVLRLDVQAHLLHLQREQAA